MISAFFHGIILAIGLIIPLGVQNFFIFSQGATKSKLIYVLPVILTASLCDTLLILLAVSGVSLIVINFLWMKTILVLLGTLFLLYMGFITWKATPQTNTNEIEEQKNLPKLISYTFMISLINPHAILDTIGVIGTSSLNFQGSDKISFTIACIAVSWLWFFILALLGRFVGRKDDTGKFVQYLNKISAMVMWAACIFLIVAAFS
jgi:L-lysine exporter family protein LysE/ArgO